MNASFAPCLAADAAWLETTCRLLLGKLERTSRRIGAGLPTVSLDGTYRDWHRANPEAYWTNGFWPGLLWLAYRETGDGFYAETATRCEARMDGVLMDWELQHHDLGFMWSLSSVANFLLTGNPDSRRRAMSAAALLASRFNIRGRFIRAWNAPEREGWAIVDCLMNLPLLHWASAQCGDERFAAIAREHADTAIRAIQRPDGSMNHVVCFDPATGEVLDSPGGQGYAKGSAWSRGQAWGIYGFALSFRHTREIRYLDAAKRVAHYFIASVADDWLPATDFRAPLEPVHRDSSAGAVAACGLLEIASHVPELEQTPYLNAAWRLLRSLDRHCTCWDDPGEEGLLLHGSHAYFPLASGNPNDTPIIYGDYFFAEALFRLRGRDELFW